MTITTTTEHLAQRLGHALARSFAGKVRYGFSHDNKVTHVWWRRDGAAVTGSRCIASVGGPLG